MADTLPTAVDSWCGGGAMEMEAILKRKTSKEAIEHILRTNNEFRMMGLPPSSQPPHGLKKRYHAISKLIHPDKCTDPRATEAMQKLTEAKNDLSDQSKLPGNRAP